MAGGETEWYLINRLQCSNDECRRLHNELPDNLIPYKHYDAQLIEDVVDGVVSEADRECEDYPCEQTMNHWNYWLQINEDHIDGKMKSTADCLLDLGMLMAYHLLQKDMETKNTPKKESSSECSNLEAILYMIGGLVAMGIIFTFLGIDAHDVPAILLLVLWFVFVIIIMVAVIRIGSKRQ